MNTYAEEVKNRIPMAALADRIGLKVDRHGYATCPFHGEKTGSLRIYPGNRGWHCFGCHAGGSVIDFAMRWYGLGFSQALVRLNYDFSLGLPLGRKMTEAERTMARRQEELARREREARKRRKEEAEAEYWLAFRVYQLLDRIVADGQPKRPEDPIDDTYAEALKRIPEARYACQRAYDAWKEQADGRNQFDSPMELRGLCGDAYAI